MDARTVQTQMVLLCARTVNHSLHQTHRIFATCKDSQKEVVVWLQFLIFQKIKNLKFMQPLYQYKGRVNKVYDGDTITDMTIDLGFGVKMTEEDIRLYGINTAELRDSKNNIRSEEEKARATEATRVLSGLTVGQDVIIRTFKTSALKSKEKKEKYGRWLALVHVPSARVEAFFGVGSKLDLIIDDCESGKISTHTSNEEYMCVNDILVTLKLAVVANY